MTDSPNETQKTTQPPHNSTLIEFPGVNRNRPAWRKELSEKVREIQQRRAREAALEAGDGDGRAQRAPAATRSPEPASAQSADALTDAAGEEAAKQLGLVPQPEAPELNPLVVAALRRIERARTRMPHAPRPASGRGQAAAARVLEETFEPEEEQAQSPEQVTRPAPAARPEKSPAARPEKAEATHASNLVVVAGPNAEAQHRTQPSPQGAAATAPRSEPSAEDGAAAGVTTAAAAARATRPAAKPEAKPTRPAVAAPEASPATAAVRTGPAVNTATTQTVAAESAAEDFRPQPRKLMGVLDDHWLERHGSDALPKVEAAAYDDRAPVGRRVGAALFDLLAVAALCAPFAAVIELTIGGWQEPRVLGSMGGIVAVVMFLYHTCAVALAGRSWGMRFFSLHVVDADSARVPTTWQCAVRALTYMFSLAAFGIGVLYALFDAEGRTAHDLLSRTVVVKE